MRLATYNIHSCRGTDGREDARRVADVLAEVDADIVGLQEVYASTDPHENHLDILRPAGGYQSVDGPTLARRRGTFGNVLLSRYPIESVKHYDITATRFREPRGVIDALIATPDGPLRVIVSHLGLGMWERRHQARRLLDILDDADAAPEEGTPTVLMADFNDWSGMGQPLRVLNARLGRAASGRSFPSLRPVLSLDRIWVAPASRIRSHHVHATPAARRASDHLPLVVEVA